MPQAINAFLALPTPVLALVSILFWGLVAWAVHALVVPRLCGRDGRELGRFEAEVTSQIAVAFGLLISFNAVWIWDRAERVRGAIFDEAAALTRIVDDVEDLAEDGDPARRARRDEICAAVRTYAVHLVESEWPTLADCSTDRARPAALTSLRRTLRTSGDEAMLQSLRDAEDARDVRIREGLAVMPPPRWGVVFALGALLLVSLGALHGESPRARKLALALVTIAIASCFAVLFASARPFVGDYAMPPDLLREVVFRASTNS